MEQFVCVRIVQGNSLDLTRFQFDYDLTFAVFFLNPDGTIYGRYGSRSSHDDGEHDISAAGYRAALEAALALHRQFPAVRDKLTKKQSPPTPFKKPEEYPSLREFKPKLDYDGKVARSCVHCHQIRDAERKIVHERRERLTDKELFPFPMPDVVGLKFDPQHRATVANVTAASPAAEAGFKTGDELLEFDSQSILSIADVQWALHHTADKATLPATVRRGGKVQSLTLTLPSGWRRAGDISWRPTSWDLRRMALGGMWLQTLADDKRDEEKIPGDRMALFAKHVGQYGEHAVAKRAGFLNNDIIVAFDGLTENLRETDLFAHVLQKKKRGDTVPITILRDKKRMEMKITLP